MSDGGLTGAQMMAALQRFGVTSPRPPEPPSAWDRIVGIDLDEWIRAGDSDEQIRWLAHLRDHPMPQQGRRRRETCASCIEVVTAGDRVVRTVSGRDCRHR